MQPQSRHRQENGPHHDGKRYARHQAVGETAEWVTSGVYATDTSSTIRSPGHDGSRAVTCLAIIPDCPNPQSSRYAGRLAGFAGSALALDSRIRHRLSDTTSRPGRRGFYFCSANRPATSGARGLPDMIRAQSPPNQCRCVVRPRDATAASISGIRRSSVLTARCVVLERPRRASIDRCWLPGDQRKRLARPAQLLLETRDELAALPHPFERRRGVAALRIAFVLNEPSGSAAASK